jgi:2-iminobutanoate/2-iminopropanoate deaminase
VHCLPRRFGRPWRDIATGSPAGHRLVFTAGQLGIAPDESIPADGEAQADLCFANIAAILAEDGMTLANNIRLSVYVTAREHMQGYRRSRDRQFPGTPPTTTLIMVSGLARPEFVVEIEAIAAAPERVGQSA